MAKFGTWPARLLIALVAISACGGSKGSTSSSGPVATDLQTSINGWSFPNYPASSFPDTDFNEEDLVSMFGSGKDICVGAVAKPCTLTAEASAWARMVNQSRASGHCEGLVAIASTRFNNKETPETVKLPSQSETLHAIMRAFATQFLPEVQDAITLWLNKSLEEKIDELTKSFATGKLNYTLGVYTNGGGHAILPYAIEYPTPNTPRILLYDSNWPGKNRYVDIDLTAKTWRFSFSGADPANDPDAWTGGPQDMDLTPLSAREGTCPFCGDGVKVAKTTMLIRSSNLDWSVETDGGVVSPANPVGTDGTSVLPVKGALKRDSYDYLVSVPTSSGPKSTTTVASKEGKKVRSKLKFSGSTSVYAIMPNGIAQFSTPGTSDNPVEIEGSSISTKDPGVDLTLASGNLVANASGAAISLSVSGGTMEVAVTTASGQVVQQQVSEDKPTLQMKADPTGGGITVLAASSTGVVEKTEVSSSGVETKTIVKEVLNLNAVKAELPPELASKEIAALPSLANRNMANPNYKVDPVYTAPTTTAPKESSGGVSSKGLPQEPTVGKLVLPSVEFGDVPFTVQAPTSNSKGEWKFTSSKPDIAQINTTTGRITIAGAGTTTITATQAAVKDYESISVTAELTVARATPVLGAFTTTTRTVGDEAFGLASPTSTSSAVFKIESSDESVARFSKVNGKLSIVGAGKTTITASQPANDDYLAASKNFVLTVRKGTPVLSAIAELSSTFGEVGPTIAKPTSESRGAVSFASSNTAVATINATTGQVTVVGAGTSTITATQAPTDDYVSATQTFAFTVKQAVPSLGKLTTESKKFGDAEFSIEKPTSPSTGTFTFTSSDSKVVKITEEGKVTIAGAGTTTITATQAAAGNYAANSITAEITVAKAAPVLSNISLTGVIFGDADSTMEPRSTSSGAFTFSSNNTRVLTVNATTGRVRVVAAGTATITVKQASTANYEAASSAVTVQVGLATPAFERLDPIAKEFGDATFLFNWGTSPSDGVISYESSNSTTATIDATTGRVTIRDIGVTTLTMSQAKGTNHSAASVVAVLTVSRGTPVYGDFVITNKTWGAAPFLLTRPTSTSSGAFTFTSSNTSVATVNSSTGLVTIVAPGSVEIIATQAQTLTHTASTSTTTFVVDAAAPTFGSFVAPAKTFGDATFTMSAPTSSSSGAFTFGSSNTGVATINSSTGVVTIVGAGSTTITTSQAAATTYAARSTTATFTVAKATPSLSSFGGETAGLSGTRYVNYYADNPNWFATATLQGQTVTSTQIQNFTSISNDYSWQWLGTFRSTAAGTYIFCTASDDASHLWIGATAASGFTVSNAVVNNGGLHGVHTRCGNITLAASTDYPIRIQFGEWTGGDAMNVYFTPPGGSATYNGTGYFFTGGGLSKNVGDQPFTPTIPSSASTGAITYSSSNPAVASINPASGLITVLSGGTTTITAEQAATNNFNSSTVSTTLTVIHTLAVTTDEQGGSAIIDVSTTAGGTISASPGTPTRSGYTFNGWFTASSGGSALSFPYTHNQTANFTLYARWTAADVVVTVNANGSDTTRSLAEMPDGSMVVLGNFTGTATFGSTTLTAQSNDAYYQDGYSDLYIARVTRDGDWIWAKKFDSDIEGDNSSSGDTSSHLSVGPDGSIFVTGWLAGNQTAQFDTISISNVKPYWKPFIAKMDAGGNWIWARLPGGDGYFFGGVGALPVAAASDGSAFVAMTFAYGDITLGSINIPFAKNYSGQNLNQYSVLARIDKDGNWLWANGMIPRIHAAGLQTDSLDNVYISGGFGETKSGFFTGSFTDAISAALGKFDSQGNLLWEKWFPSPAYSYAYVRKMFLQQDGTFVIAGTATQGTAFGNTSTTPGQTSYVAKLSASGTLQWTTIMGGADVTILNGIVTKPNGTIVVSGTYHGESSFGTSTFAWPGGRYGVYIEMNQNGAFTSVNNYGNYQRYNHAIDLDLLSDGSIVLTGNVDRGGVNIRSNTVPNATDSHDGFILIIRPT